MYEQWECETTERVVKMTAMVPSYSLSFWCLIVPFIFIFILAYLIFSFILFNSLYDNFSLLLCFYHCLFNTVIFATSECFLFNGVTSSLAIRFAFVKYSFICSLNTNVHMQRMCVYENYQKLGIVTCLFEVLLTAILISGFVLSLFE